MASDQWERSREVARIIETTVAKSFKLDKDEMDSALDNVEQECLAGEIPEWEKIEVRRRILEWKVRLYCDKNLPLAEVRSVESSSACSGQSFTTM